MLLDRAGGRPATLWPYSQALHAAALVAHLRGADEPLAAFGDGVAAYRQGRAYRSRRGWNPARRFVDDNAWVGLAASQASLLSRTGRPGANLADRQLRWVLRHQVPSGGVRWREGSTSLNACSTGAVGVLALRAPTASAGVADVARLCAAFLLGPLCRPDGLVADNVDDGVVDPSVWSYNQGLAIGLLTLLHGRGDMTALDRARELATICVDHFAREDRLWREPPAFVGVLGRMLLLLHTIDRDPRWVAVVDEYLDRVWDRTSASGFTGSGIGAYDREHSLDLAGLTILTALRAMPSEELSRIC
jgi:hypothetical protein